MVWSGEAAMMMYWVQMILDCALDDEEIGLLRQSCLSPVVTNAHPHPLPGRFAPLKIDNEPLGYVAALVRESDPAEAATTLGSWVRTVIGEGHIQDMDVKAIAFVPPEVFECPACGRVNRHPNDVAERYCGDCHHWTGRADRAWERPELFTQHGRVAPPKPTEVVEPSIE
jgi:hypothetical protein